MTDTAELIARLKPVADRAVAALRTQLGWVALADSLNEFITAAQEAADALASLVRERDELQRQIAVRDTAVKNAALTLGAIYEWLDRVDDAGGATSISGIAACNAFLASLRKNRSRCNTLIIKPLMEAINGGGKDE